jgi:hypothetical protein
MCRTSCGARIECLLSVGQSGIVVSLVSPRGFEPLTFGSGGRWLRKYAVTKALATIGMWCGASSGARRFARICTRIVKTAWICSERVVRAYHIC